MLKIENLTVVADNKQILKDFNLTINKGEIHVLMGPNGTGKSTLCKVLMRYPDYIIKEGTINFDGNDIKKLDSTSISRLGVFLLSQNPIEVEGVSNSELLRTALSEKTNDKIDIFKFNKKLKDICEKLNIPKEFIHRDVNYNMSGGEKKKNELMHLFMLEPNFIILDEIDSGLDVDALKTVGSALKEYYTKFNPAILIVTHHTEILNYFDDFKTHILDNGSISLSGDKSLVKRIENDGFKASIIDKDNKHE